MTSFRDNCQKKKIHTLMSPTSNQCVVDPLILSDYKYVIKSFLNYKIVYYYRPKW